MRIKTHFQAVISQGVGWQVREMGRRIQRDGGQESESWEGGVRELRGISRGVRRQESGSWEAVVRKLRGRSQGVGR